MACHAMARITSWQQPTQKIITGITTPERGAVRQLISAQTKVNNVLFEMALDIVLVDNNIDRNKRCVHQILL